MYLYIIIFLTILLLSMIISVFHLVKYEISLKGKSCNDKISIIIPARNEEKFIAETLESIKNQTDGNFELVIIVDRSIDSTLKIAEEFAAAVNFQVKIINNYDDPPDSRNPKVSALKKGIKAADGNIFLFTDADCTVPVNWIKHYRKMFSQKNTGLVFGALFVKSDRSLLSNFQKFDHVYRMFYAFACAGVGIATGAFGNNMAISRDCYESIGSFENLPESVTEDGVLVSAVGKDNYYKVRSIVSSEAAVTTHPKKGLTSYLNQSFRWTAGAIFGPDFKSKFFYIFMLIVLTFANLSIPLSYFFPSLTIIPVSGYIYLFVSGIVAGYFMQVDYKYWIYLIPSLFLFFVIYQITFIISLFRPPLTWKGSFIRMMVY